MTTLQNNIESLVSQLFEYRWATGFGISPEMLQNVKGILYFKEVRNGDQQRKKCLGMFIARSAARHTVPAQKDEWSLPVAIRFRSGEVVFDGNMVGTRRPGMLILINNEDAVHQFRECGIIDFGSKIRPGEVLFSRDKGVSLEGDGGARMKKVSSNYGSSYAFVLGKNGALFWADLHNPLVEFRESSNEKFYHVKRDVNVKNILQPTDLNLESENLRAVRFVHKSLSKFCLMNNKK